MFFSTSAATSSPSSIARSIRDCSLAGASSSAGAGAATSTAAGAAASASSAFSALFAQLSAASATVTISIIFFITLIDFRVSKNKNHGKGTAFYSYLQINRQFLHKKRAAQTGRFFPKVFCTFPLSNKLLSDGVNFNNLYYLYLSVSAGVLAAFFLAALVAAAHSSKCYSYDKKHLFHFYQCFLS